MLDASSRNLYIALFAHLNSRGLAVLTFPFNLCANVALLSLKAAHSRSDLDEVENAANMTNDAGKRGLKECKWSSLNAQGTKTPLSHPIYTVG